MLYTAFALLIEKTHKFSLQTVQNNGTGENKIIYIPTMTLRGDCVAKKLNLVDMYGIGVMLEYLVAEDNLT